MFNEWLKIKERAVEKWRFQRIETAWGSGDHVYHHSLWHLPTEMTGTLATVRGTDGNLGHKGKIQRKILTRMLEEARCARMMRPPKILQESRGGICRAKQRGSMQVR